MRLLFLIGAVVLHATSSNAVVPLNSAIRSVNTFSNNVVKAIFEDASANLVCSPLSADMVLSMAAFGARGDTEKILRSALALTDDDAVIKNGFQSLVDSLNDSKGFELRLANKIFLAEGLNTTDDFKDVTETAFRSPAQSVDFSDPSAASKTINDWSAARTNNHIKEIVKSDDLTSGTALVLVNAIYFRANWENSFEPRLTKARPFHVNGKSVKDVLTMSNTETYNYGKLPEVKAKFVELPYELSENPLDDVSMFIILPDEIDGIADLVKNLNEVTVERLQQVKLHHVRITLPKFKIDSTIDLQQSLNKLGLAEIFSNKADFSGIVASPKVKVDKIVQKAFIEVNEIGTEATATTTLSLTNRFGNSGRTVEFNVDHPFVAVIATKRGVPLFSAVVSEPIY